MMSFAGLEILAATLVVAVALGVGARRVLGGAAGGRVEDAFLTLGFGWVLLSWWGIVVAEAGTFTPLVFLGAPAVLAAAMFAGGRANRPPRPAGEVVSALAAVITVTLICAVFFSPAFDVRLEARDPGVYLHAGQTLARDGAISWHDETVTRLPGMARDYFFPGPGRPAANDGSRYLGFYLESLTTGRVIPQALPVYPVWVAVAYWVAGTAGALAAGGVLTWLAACVLSLLGAAFCGRLGLLAGPLLAMGVITGWFARYSSAETAAQLLVVLGCLALIRYRQHGGRFHGLLAGASFGLCPLAKAELLVVLLPLGLLFLADIAMGRLRQRDIAVFWAPVAFLAVHTLVHAIGWLWPYYFDVLRQFYLTPPTFFGAAALGAALAGAAGLAVHLVARRHREPIRGFLAGETPGGRLLRAGTAAVVVVLTAAGYWLRPWLYAQWEASDSWNMANHVELGLGISPMLVLLATLGTVILLVRRRQEEGLLPAATVLLVLTATVMWERNIIPSPMWAYRRWIPAVLPASYLFGLVAVAWISAKVSQRRAYAGVAAAVLLAPVLAHHATAANAIKRHVQLEGSDAALHQLADLFGPEDAVLFERRSRRGLIRFEAALGLDIGLAVYRLPDARFDAAAIRSLAWERARHGGDVYLVTAGGLDELVDVGVEPVQIFRWQSLLLEEFYMYEEVKAGRPIRLPVAILPLTIEARVYRLQPEESIAPLPQRVVDGELRGELDVGLWDDQYLVGGLMYSPEVSGEHSFRWTGSRAVILLPGMPADADEVVLRVRGNEFLPAHEIEVWLDGVRLGAAAPPSGWGDLRFPLPAEWTWEADVIARLELRIPAAQPHAEGSGLARVLGTRIERVFWARAEQRDER